MFMKTIFLLIFCLALCPTALFSQNQSNRDTGIEFYRAGNFDKTAEILETVTANDKGDTIAWLYLGAAYVKLGKKQEAVKAFQKSNYSYKDEGSSDFDKKLKVNYKPRASYTDEARQNNISGTIKIAIEYSADGKIGFLFPFQTLPYGLTENTIAAAKAINFEPAMKNGKPVAVVSVVTYIFSIY
jgi:tetratricopeptide (TPR) repeat protein